MTKHPGTSGTMPVKGSGCGIRPDLEEMSEDTAFDFSKAQKYLVKDQEPSTRKDSLVEPENDDK